MDSMNSFLLLVLSILLFIALALGAISGLDKLLSNPSAILTSTSCDPPCWNGITPGQEDPWAIYETISTLEGVDSASVTINTDKQDRVSNISWNFQRPSPDAQGVIYFKDDRVQAISILTVDSLKGFRGGRPAGPEGRQEPGDGQRIHPGFPRCVLRSGLLRQSARNPDHH